MKTMMTGNEFALNVLLGPGTAQQKQMLLSREAARLKETLAGTCACPVCGDTGPHLDNGSETLCCQACGEHFDT